MGKSDFPIPLPLKEPQRSECPEEVRRGYTLRAFLLLMRRGFVAPHQEEKIFGGPELSQPPPGAK